MLSGLNSASIPCNIAVQNNIKNNFVNLNDILVSLCNGNNVFDD